MSEVAYFNPDGVAGPIGQYSHVSRSNALYVIAGQVGIDSNGNLAGTSLEEQAVAVFESIQTILESIGKEFSDVLKFTTYLVGIENISRFYAIREQIFSRIYPSNECPPNTLLVINRLVKEEYKIEVEVLVAN